MTHTNDQRTTTGPFVINRDLAADWLIRYHLPNSLEAAGFLDEVQAFRDLEPCSGVTDRGRIAAWPRIVGHLNRIRNRTTFTFWGENREYFAPSNQDPKAVWYQENILPFYEADHENPYPRELRDIDGFAAVSLSPSTTGFKAREIATTCRVIIASRHLSDGNLEFPASLTDLGDRSLDDLRKVCGLPAGAGIVVPREIIESTAPATC